MIRKIKSDSNSPQWIRAKLLGSDFQENDIEFLKFVLQRIIPKRKIPVIIEKLMEEFYNLNNVIHADKEKLLLIPGITEEIYQAFAIVKDLIKKTLKIQIINKDVISCKKELLDYLKFSMGFLKLEYFRVLFLNSKNILIQDELLSQGTVNKLPIYAREIVKRVLFHEACAIVLIHNHPSGDVTPSKFDIKSTIEIINACNTIEVKVLDHIIISSNNYFSFNEFYGNEAELSSFILEKHKYLYNTLNVKSKKVVKLSNKNHYE